MREWRGGRPRGDVIVQERIAGVPCSAAAVADGHSAVLLGVSEQLIGRPALGARGWKWCGNVVPPRLPAAEQDALADACQRIWKHLAAAFGLRGVFGVDLVWDGARPWVVEVNPRPAASLATIDAAHGVRSFTAHLEACAGRLPSGGHEPIAGRPARPCCSRPRTCGSRTRSDWTARGIRDVPHPGEAIAARPPDLHARRAGPSPQRVLADLEARAAALRAELGGEVGVDAVA